MVEVILNVTADIWKALLVNDRNTEKECLTMVAAVEIDHVIYFYEDDDLK